MKFNQKGSFVFPQIVIVVIAILTMLVYLLLPKQKPQLSSDTQTISPFSYLPQSTPKPSKDPAQLKSLPDLVKALAGPQAEFKENNFPFTFTYPAYFRKNVYDIEARKAETLKDDPQYIWRLTDEVGIIVPLDSDEYDYSTNCDDNVMRVYVSKYANIDHINLYELIKTLNATYPGGGVTETFETYKQGLTQISYPRPGSYQFKGIISENLAKKVYFEYGNSFYSFTLSGGCGTGAGYSRASEEIFDSILDNIKFN